jgi:hypothetical protein
VSAVVRQQADARTLTAADFRLVTAAERPDLAAGLPELLGSRWPVFMLAGNPGHDVDLPTLLMNHLENQVLLVDDSDTLLGAGLSVPLTWDGTVEGLPAGWDGAVTASAGLSGRGGAANTVCALSITTAAAVKGADHPVRIMNAIRAAAADTGAVQVIAPVRPVLKARYPLIPMTEYVTWQNAEGEVFDPWLRMHLDMGATVLGIEPAAMTITGSIAEWGTWTGLPFPGDGEYLIPGALAPLVVDRIADTAVYREPNVWMAHPPQS